MAYLSHFFLAANVGTVCKNGLKNHFRFLQVPDTSLLYNEFIVYDVAQVEIRYMLKLEWDYNT